MVSKRQVEISRERAWRPWSPDPIQWEGHRWIGLFAPRKDWDEPSLMEDWSKALPADRLCFPRMSQAGNELTFHASSFAALVPGRWGILEPPAQAPVVQPTLVFVPALLADREGARIGHGFGFYDRYLAQHPEAEAHALLHTDYLMTRFPRAWLQPHDQPVKGVFTESFALKFSNRQTGVST